MDSCGALRPKRDCLRSEHERDYGLGMDALVSVCSWNTKGIMVYERKYGLGMDALVSALIKKRTELWFGHGCSGRRTRQNTNEIIVWAWMLWSAYALGTRRELWFGHGCSGQRMLLEHEGNYGLGMDALVCALIKTGIDA